MNAKPTEKAAHRIRDLKVALADAVIAFEDSSCRLTRAALQFPSDIDLPEWAQAVRTELVETNTEISAALAQARAALVVDAAAHPDERK